MQQTYIVMNFSCFTASQNNKIKPKISYQYKRTSHETQGKSTKESVNQTRETPLRQYMFEQLTERPTCQGLLLDHF